MNPKEAAPAGSRQDALLSGLTPHSRIVEVGASFSPLAPKSTGWNTCVVDHDTRENLVAKYASARVELAAIEEVDIVWQSGALHEAFPATQLGTFDAVIVSHVMEHIPDLIGFLRSCQLLVNATGLLVFALPDKRWCFDVFRPISLAGDALLAHHDARRTHSPAVLFNEVAYSVTLGGKPGWAVGEPARELSFAHPPGKAIEVFQDVLSDNRTYRDAHAWQFTPASFQLMLLDLAQSGACDWRLDWVRSEPSVEFIGRLRLGAESFASDDELQGHRKELLMRIAGESLEHLEALLRPQEDPGEVQSKSSGEALSGSRAGSY